MKARKRVGEKVKGGKGLRTCKMGRDMVGEREVDLEEWRER